jgi:hypothetical protein
MVHQVDQFLAQGVCEIRKGAYQYKDYDKQGCDGGDGSVLYVLQYIGIDGIEDERKNNGPHNGGQKRVDRFIRKVSQENDNNEQGKAIEPVFRMHIHPDKRKAVP